MLVSIVKSIVSFSTRAPWLIVALFVSLTAIAGAYTATHFAIDTNINKLLSPNLDWRQRERSLEKQFPGHFNSTLIVIDAPTPELVSLASNALTQRLEQSSQYFRAVRNLSENEFFVRNGLLFQPAESVARLSNGLQQASILVSTLYSDPSLRGLARIVTLGLVGVQSGQAKLDDLGRPMSMAADTIDRALANKPAAFSWLQLINGKPLATNDTRRFIEVEPILNYAALEPGRASSAAIRKAADDLNLASQYQAHVRLTGTVPMADEEFATVKDGAVVNIIGTIVVVLVILWLALRSARIIGAVFFNLLAGLIITAALGLAMVGALNMISVAFAVLFVGLGVDFGIQFSVRYRTERHECPDLHVALSRTAAEIGAPLTLAAAAVAAGFLSFLPTEYRGLSELGQIAGVGMLIAYLTSITFLPALLILLNPPGEPDPIGYAFLAPVDEFLRRNRLAVVGGTAAVALAGVPLLFHLTFDFDPVHLRSKSAESISTLLDVQSDPRIGANAINIIVPSLQKASEAATSLRSLPQVASVSTLSDFLPKDQPEKLEAIQTLDGKLGPILQRPAGPSANDNDNIAALKALTEQLNKVAANGESAGAKSAKRLADALSNLVAANESARDRVQSIFVLPFRNDIERLRHYFQAQAITLDNLPPMLKRQWITPEGNTRVQVSPSGNGNDTEVLRNFAKAVNAAYPAAIGGPVSILESGNTVVRAFIQAGVYALLSITVLLWIVLRRFGDVLLTMVPLLVAGAITLELCVLIGLPLNFANIIALPLLLGVGVAFKIYYIMAWRAGQTNLLQSSLTRAVIWSALTTATAFGSLWLSDHPGTSSMGKLLALSLVSTMAAAVLFQPALMGSPRQSTKYKPYSSDAKI